MKLNEELNDFKISVFEQEMKKAQIIMNKYEVLTREYQSQNKTFQERHQMIIDSESKKRNDIMSNFETHLSQIKAQIKEDTEKMEQSNEVLKENESLKEQYEALIKEIAEKAEMMDNQIQEKEKTSGSIEEEMTSKISNQEDEIKKQIEIYRQQNVVKIEEEKELVKVYNDYKKKYEEFSKSMKRSKDTFKVYETEIRGMNSKIQEMQRLKKQLSEKKGKKGGSGNDANASEEANKLLSQWEQEKEVLAKDREDLKQQCQELQEQIKAIKDGNAARAQEQLAK